MMLETIRAALKAARLAKESEKVTQLSTLLGEAERDGKDDGNRESTDAEVVKTVRKFIAGLKDNLPLLTSVTDRERAVRELALLETFNPPVPLQVTGAELAAVIDGLVAALPEGARTMKSMGAVMGSLKAKLPDAFDGTEASTLVKAKLTAPAAKAAA